MSAKISVVGLGKLGSCLAAAAASKGIRVVGVDILAKTVEAINEGRAPVVEPGLDNLIRDHKELLSATTSFDEAIALSDATFIVVPTPSVTNGQFSLKYILGAIGDVGSSLKKKSSYHLVVITSTVLPGAMKGKILPALEAASGKKCGVDFGLCYNPEFIALGNVLPGLLSPDFVLIGESDTKAGDELSRWYAAFCDNSPVVERMNFVNAELTKISVNTFVTTKISFANMLANICDALPDADVDVVTRSLGRDSRIGPKYLKGALGYGGPCFPRDNRALASVAASVGCEAWIALATDQQNHAAVASQLRKLIQLTPANKTVAVLGMAYKPGTVVVEESQGLELAKLLNDSGRTVIVYDPLANDEARKSLGTDVRYARSAIESIRSADAVIIANPDPEFAKLRAEDFPHQDRKTVVIDCWRLMREQLSECDWIRYVPWGVNYKNSECAPSPEFRSGSREQAVLPSVDILGVPVSAIDMTQAVETIDRWISAGEKQYVCVANTHSINECKRDTSYKEIHQRAGMVTPDGMPLVWVSHLKGFRQVGRVDGPGLMRSVCAFGLERGYRHFLYGGWPPVVVETLAQRLTEKFPGIQIVGTHCPPFRQETPAEDQEVIAKINAARPHIVWVGLGAPKEEWLIAKHIHLLNASMLIGVGAAFDYHAGVKRRAPMWMQQLGLEWLYRLSNEPRRLGPRYLHNNPAFVKNLIVEAFAKRTP